MLDGIRVVDMTRLLPGPYATQHLADLGADVVKIEPPEGDYARYSTPRVDGEGGVFSMVNRGKRSVSLDLKDEDGLEAFYALVDDDGWDADAVVEGFRPGVADRLGVGYDDVRERNEGTVYCSLSGYGQDTDAADEAGHDLNYAAYAGLLDMTRAEEDGRPAVPGFPVGDMAGGVFCALSVVSALLGRERGDGEETGGYVDTSMAESLLSFSQAVVPDVLADGDAEARETALTGGYACYDVYETADGGYATLAALEPKFWSEFCEVVGREELVGEHPGDAETRDEVADILASKTVDEWNETFDGTDVPFRRVRSVDEALEDEDVQERLVRGGDEAPPRVGFPAKTASEVERETDESLPSHGEHTEEVLREAGWDDEEIEGL
ncbi:MAG: alpha-methylacyl-CoA racemase [Methanobacteriota archaeon]|jgi:alpha-methylacyl-CoA racemase